MPTPVKISVIGAGSAVFSLGLVKDLCLTTNLAGSEVSFMDIDSDRLEMVHRLATRYAAELGASVKFEATTDREASLSDADFVINTAAGTPSHHAHARALRELTEKRGYYYGGSDGRGSVVGSFYEFRLMLAVARDIERLCPKAWLIQSGNPVFDGSTLMTRETGVKVIGLCHGHYGYRTVAETIGLDPARVTWQAPGFNHCIWLTHFLYDGVDAYPKLDEWIETSGEEYWRTHVPTKTHDIQMSRGTIHQYWLYGLMPIGDTPRQGSWWYHTDFDTKLRWFGAPWGGPDTHVGRPVYVAEHERRMAEAARVAGDPRSSVVDFLGTDKTDEQQVPIIDALTNNVAGQFQVNVPNRGGVLEGVPENVVVEVPAVVDRKGVQPLHVGALPRKIMLEQIYPRWLAMERDIEAFKTGDYTMLLYDVLSAHQTRSYDQGVAVLDELLAMEAHGELAAHYPKPRHP